MELEQSPFPGPEENEQSSQRPTGRVEATLPAVETIKNAAPLRREQMSWYQDKLERAKSQLPHFESLWAEITRKPEGSELEIVDKMGAVYRAASQLPLRRHFFWREMARLEASLGHRETAAVYRLRMLRNADEAASPDELAGLTAELLAMGQKETAEAVAATFGPEASALSAYLDKALRHRLETVPLPGQIIDLRRPGPPKISLIVSLYRAAGKLERFLSQLSQQTLIRRQPESVELIFQDSDSPDDEFGALMAFHGRCPLNMVYERSPSRETIPAAWNRGLKLSRAPYLSFLGVDEAVYPEALARLSDELDNDPELSWVMGDGLVTAVDSGGNFQSYVRPLRRTGGETDLVYLDYTYLGYVGGLYRRNLHDIWGPYDETFTGASDVEFITRVLPKLKTRYLPETFGLFLDYPETRVTSSSFSELENYRAGFLHASRYGVERCFKERTVDDIKAQLIRCLGYRLSCYDHCTSTDINYALNLARLGYQRTEDAFWQELALDFEIMKNLLKQVDEGDDRGHLSPETLEAIISKFNDLQTKHARIFKGRVEPRYLILNDARHEKFSWLWSPTGSAIND